MKVLQLTVHFSPNVGGVETHLDDLVKSLKERDWQVVILTYRPLTVNTSWKFYENSNNETIIRIPWIPYLFYKFVQYPILEFLYLLPGLFFSLPFILIWQNPDVIHAHGLIAGFVGVFWGRIFRKRVVISTHSIYNFPRQGIYRRFISGIFGSADYCLGLSKQAVAEIRSLGIPYKKINNFTYWLNLRNFQKISDAKKVLGWNDKFIVLFVGRLVPEKGIAQLLGAAKLWDKRINLIIIGFGPMEKEVKIASLRMKNLQYIGIKNQSQLPVYYSSSDIVIVPSISEEGFGRVILEALACGTPVVGANRGAIPEIIDQSVGKLIDVKAENIKQAVEYFYSHKKELKKLAKNCRKFTERRFSEKNVETIIRAYKI